MNYLNIFIYKYFKKKKYYNNTITEGSPLEVPPDTPLYDLLQKEEIQTCSLLRILPAQYLRIRDILIQGYKKNGYFLKKDAKKWCRGIDVNKVNINYFFFLKKKKKSDIYTYIFTIIK